MGWAGTADIAYAIPCPVAYVHIVQETLTLALFNLDSSLMLVINSAILSPLYQVHQRPSLGFRKRNIVCGLAFLITISGNISVENEDRTLKTSL